MTIDDVPREVKLWEDFAEEKPVEFVHSHITMHTVIAVGVFLFTSFVIISTVLIGFSQVLLVSAASYPDLIVTDVSWTPASPSPGEKVTFKATIKNIGTAPLYSSSLTAVLFQVDLGTSSYFGCWGSGYYTLYPGSSITISANGGSKGPYWTAAAGSHTVKAYADDVNRIPELNNYNNVRIEGFSVSNGLPDLVVTDISMAPQTPYAGDQVTFRATIKNQGSAPTPSTTHGVLFQLDEGTNSYFGCWSDNYKSSIPAGGSVTVTANGGSSGSAWTASAGSHTLKAYADDVDRIDESNEGNNVRTESFSVTAAPTTLPPTTPTTTPTTLAGGYDLIVSDIELVPAAPEEGEKVTFKATIRNQGSQATPSGVIHGVLFQVYEASGGYFGCWSSSRTTSIPAGQSVTLTADGGSNGIYWTAKGGAHSIKATVDDVNRMPYEIYENNNVLTESFTIGVSSGGGSSGDGYNSAGPDPSLIPALPSWSTSPTKTVYVASSASQDSRKTQAYRICSTTEDCAPKINEALNYAGSGGKVVLLDGTFILRTDVLPKYRTTLEGLGSSRTVLKMYGSYIHVKAENVVLNKFKFIAYGSSGNMYRGALLIRTSYVYVYNIDGTITNPGYQSGYHAAFMVLSDEKSASDFKYGKEIQYVYFVNCNSLNSNGWGFLNDAWFYAMDSSVMWSGGWSDTYGWNPNPNYEIFRHFKYINCTAINSGVSNWNNPWSTGFNLVEHNGAVDFQVINCYAKGTFQSGFHMDWFGIKQDITFMDCLSEYNGKAPYPYPSWYPTSDPLYFGSGFYAAWGIKNMKFINCKAVGNSFRGFWVQSGENVEFTNCVAESSGTGSWVTINKPRTNYYLQGIRATMTNCVSKYSAGYPVYCYNVASIQKTNFQSISDARASNC